MSHSALISFPTLCDNHPNPVYNCSAGLVLSFQSASYTGATSNSVCNSSCVNCAAGCNFNSSVVLSSLKTRCDGRNSCSIPFKDSIGAYLSPFGTDLCPGTLKALVATASCVQGNRPASLYILYNHDCIPYFSMTVQPVFSCIFSLPTIEIIVCIHLSCSI